MKVVRLFLASSMLILAPTSGQVAMAQKRDPDLREDVSRQRISRLSAQAIFIVKNKMERDGISHIDYDFFVSFEQDTIAIEANYRTDPGGEFWNHGLRGCAARGREICRFFIVRKSDFKVIDEGLSPQ